MPLTAVRHVRKMRGGAQSHLLEADDGNWYVVKFRNNPQHWRVLVNELLCGALLDYLRIAAPATALIHVSGDFLTAHPEVHLTLGANRLPVEAGWQFGSRYPGDPARTAVYDFVPEALLGKIANLDEFRAVLVFDKWVGNTDGRQAVFYRAMVRQEAGDDAPRPLLVARMIDHGFAFNGPGWDFSDSPLHGIYARHSVYDSVRSLSDFEPWLGQMQHFPEEVIDVAWKRIPSDWVKGEEDELERMLERLYERRGRLPELVAACRNGRVNPFRNWRAPA
ncbi:MAG TPA: HipA family kinase [Bryobacteraceae bacterium]|nr:HipA family kinase [Bryobacteraceae bacterium]